MNILSRLIKADETRKSRFHTANGHICLNPFEFMRAFVTTINRAVFHRYSRVPWLSFSAISYLEPLITGKRVFEFGSGMSTLWFAERCSEVVAVESDKDWHRIVTAQLEGVSNVKVIHAPSTEKYLGALLAAGDYFDLILIDGLYRSECLDLAKARLKPEGIVVVDDTDLIPELDAKIKQLFPDSRVMAFRGWVSGNLHPHETTIVREISTPKLNAESYRTRTPETASNPAR
jgi:hypothetical protein